MDPAAPRHTKEMPHDTFPAAPPAQPAMTEPLILYATMTGNARDAAELLASQLRNSGLAPRVEQIPAWDPRRLSQEKTVFFLTSTFGDGDPPDTAFTFWDILRKADTLDLSGLRFAVVGFGDSTYPRFCKFGRDLDHRLAELGAKRLLPRLDCDVDWEEPFEKWLPRAEKAIQQPES